MAKATGKLRQQDIFYHMAKDQGYRSRAAIKLHQLDTCFSFLSTARAVLDLGAAPGGWLQVAVRGSTPGAFVVGVDIAPIRPIRGAISLTEDITATARCSAAVRRLMDSKGVTAFDVVLHDGAIGQKKKRKRDDGTSQSALLIDAVRLATMFLAPKGAFITKFIKRQDFNAIRFCLEQLFEKVRVSKPGASLSRSAEFYFVCLEYKAPAKIQPELFDLKHLFTVSLEKNKPRDEVPNPMETGSRRRTSFIGIPFPKAGRALDFIWSEAQTPQEILGSFMGVSFDDPASLPIKEHELTTPEIRNFCENLDLLDKKTLNFVWEWRTRIRKALSSCSQVTPKHDVTMVDAMVKHDDQLVDKTEELTSITDGRTMREKGQSSCRAKHGKEAVDSAELDIEDGIGDGGKEETQTHEEMDSDKEQHRHKGMIDDAHEGFVIKNGEVKQQRKRANPVNPYGNSDLFEKPKEYVIAKKRARVRDYKGKALVVPRMKDKNTSGYEKKVGKEEAKCRRALAGRREGGA